MANIKTVAGRSALPVIDRIRWTKHAVGQYIGFRKNSSDHGTWWAKYLKAGTKTYYFKQLEGVGGEISGAKSYDAALKAALVWFHQGDAGVTPHNKTVLDACQAHVAAIRSEKGESQADDALARLTRLVYGDQLASQPLSTLKRSHVDGWRARAAATPARVTRHKSQKREQVTRPRSASTLNRDMVPLRAALNRALDAGLLVSDLAWRVALRPTKNADGRRDIYLDRVERAALIAKASDEIKPFLRALATLPLRPGALAALRAGDYNARLRTLTIGQDKAGKDRKITLPPATAATFSELAKGKLPAAALIPRSEGRHWGKDSWKGPLKDAALDANLPAATTAYTLRHSVITDLVQSGLDLLTIAQISGTSVAMIEKHYGHLRQQRAAEALATLTL